MLHAILSVWCRPQLIPFSTRREVLVVCLERCCLVGYRVAGNDMGDTLDNALCLVMLGFPVVGQQDDVGASRARVVKVDDSVLN